MIYKVRFPWDVYRHAYIEGGVEETREVHYDLLRGEPLRARWRPIRYLKRAPELSISSFFNVHEGGLIGVMPETLESDELRCQMEADGELLPILFGEEEAYLFHCLTTLEALDRKKSKVYKLGNGEGCSKTVFQRSFATDHWFFRVPQSIVCFATDGFHDFYMSHELTGLELQPQQLVDG